MPSIMIWTITVSMCSLAILAWGLLMFFARQSKMEKSVLRRFGMQSGAYLLGWLLLALGLGGAGIFQASSATVFPWIALGVSLPILTSIFLLRRSSSLNRVIEMIPIHWLVGVQLYRAFGIIFLLLYTANFLPAEFAIPAGFGDVLVGVTAPVVGYLFYKGYRWACIGVLAWNLIGILDLAIAITIGFLSSPGPFHVLATEAPNELITAFPLVLVPVFAVPLSIVLHLVTLRRLKAGLVTASNKRMHSDSQKRHAFCCRKSHATFVCR